MEQFTQQEAPDQRENNGNPGEVPEIDLWRVHVMVEYS